jgi:acetyl/propionyl-CoA carboxylase alpha subunit
LTRLAFNDSSVEISADGNGYSISWDGQPHHVEVLEASNGRLDLSIDGRRVPAYISTDGQARWVTVDGRTLQLTRSSAVAHRGAGHDGRSELAAPMPGQVRAVNVEPGDQVTKGQVLVVLEAMKMEIRLQAPFDGQVSAVDASVGQTVEREQVLVKLQRPQDEGS